MASMVQHRHVEIDDPPIERLIFNDTRFSIVWLIVRLYLAYSWLDAGWEKLGNPAWTQTGAALKGFWQSAVSTGAGTTHPAIAFGWYRDFIQYLINAQAWTWFAKLIVAGELLTGLFLLLGAFTGIAAFVGGFLNWNFMMAGSASINPLLFTLSILVMIAWKNAGWLGLDRWLLPLFGTPWRPAIVLAPPEVPEPARAQAPR